MVGLGGVSRDVACEFEIIWTLPVEPAHDLGVVDVEGASNIEVGAAVFEEVEGLEVLGAVGEAFVVVFGCGKFLGGVVGFQACSDIFGRGDVVVVCVELADLFVSLGFGEHAFEFVV
jgi:hypothetical protein